jgi:hypothetical protein
MNSLAACEQEWKKNHKFRLNAIHSTYKAVHTTSSVIMFAHSRTGPPVSEQGVTDKVNTGFWSS